jgi:LysM repeat protein
MLQAKLEQIDASSLMKWDQVMVQRGDTLSELSSRHHVPVSVLRESNKLRNDTIHPGQKLLLPRDDQLLVDPLYAQAAMELATLQSGLLAADLVTHRVRNGESLSVIARRYGVTVQDLQRWNNITDPRPCSGANHGRPQPGGAAAGQRRHGTVRCAARRLAVEHRAQVQGQGQRPQELEQPRRFDDPAGPVHPHQSLIHARHPACLSLNGLSCCWPRACCRFRRTPSARWRSRQGGIFEVSSPGSRVRWTPDHGVGGRRFVIGFDRTRPASDLLVREPDGPEST